MSCPLQICSKKGSTIGVTMCNSKLCLWIRALQVLSNAFVLETPSACTDPFRASCIDASLLRILWAFLREICLSSGNHLRKACRVTKLKALVTKWEFAETSSPSS